MKTKEFEKFDRAMDQLLSVPHSEIKKKLDAEKAAKLKKKAARQKGRRQGKDNQEENRGRLPE